MRDKLVNMNQILEGLTLGTLGMVSRAATRHIAEPTPGCNRRSKNFQQQTADLVRHAKEESAEAGAFDLVRMNITCDYSHRRRRDEAARGK